MATMPRFSPRHLQVITIIGKGHGMKTAALQLGITRGTVKTHVAMISTKLAQLYPTYQPRERLILYYREHVLSTPEHSPPSP